MKRRKINYYDSFSCIADQCPATCCSGWAIQIDEEALGRYEKIVPSQIDWDQECFKQKADGDCIFLRKDRLCQMYIDYGEECLCKTCTLYPRHIEEFPNVREYTLSVSCPVVANTLLSMEEAVCLVEISDDEIVDEEEYEEFEDDLYQMLCDLRRQVIGTLQNRTLPIRKRFEQSLSLLANAQAAWDGVESKEGFPSREESFRIFEGLEPLQENFRVFVEEAKQQKTSAEENFWKNHPETEVCLEQIAVYFILTYLCGAAYDEYIYAMGAQAIYNAWMILWLWSAKEEKKGEKLTLEEMTQIAYAYSWELEHSTENMICLEQMLEERRDADV